MTDAWRSIKLTDFEHVVTGPTRSLLRVCGRAPLDRAPGPRPVLVMETDAGQARFHALRAPDHPSGVIRAAYSVPTSLVADGARCWLESSDGGQIELPAPVEGAGRVRDEDPFADDPLVEPMAAAEPAPPSSEPDAATAQADARAQSAEERESAATARAQAAEQATHVAQSRAAALEAELAAQAPARESLHEEISSLQSRRLSLERELDQCRDQLRLMTFEREEIDRQVAAFDAVAVKARERAATAEAATARSAATLDELQLWRGELERRLADTTTGLGALRATRDSDERELVRLRDALAEQERRGGPRGANGADPGGGDGDIVALQAAEIQRLAAELAELRSRAARGG